MDYKQILIFILFFLLLFQIKATEKDSLLSLIKTAQDQDKAEIFNNLSNTTKGNNYEMAYFYSKKALLFGEKYKQQQEIAIAYGNIGIYYYYKTIFDSSLYYFFKADSIIKTNNLEDKIQVLSNIAIIYDVNNNNKKAIEYSMKSLEFYKNNNDSIHISKALNNIGILYRKAGNTDSAMIFLEQSLKIKRSFKDTLGFAFSFANIGDIYADMNDKTNAVKYYNKAIEIFKQYNKIDIISMLYISYGKLYIKIEDYKNAENYLLKAIRTDTILSTKKNNIDAYYQLAIVYENLHDYFNAFKANKKYNKLNNELKTIEKENYISKLHIEYETKNNIQQIENNERLIQNRTKLLYIFIIAFIISVIFAVLFLIRNNRLNTTYKLLVKQSLNKVSLEDNIDNELVIDDKSRYSGSHLSEKEKSLIEFSISKIIRKDKLYLKNNFSITELAELLNYSRNNISQVINEKFGQNFNSFLNEFRVNEALRMMSKKENEVYTIEAISKMVGFNSISSFNKAFKKVSGVTPSFFTKSIEKK